MKDGWDGHTVHSGGRTETRKIRFENTVLEKGAGSSTVVVKDVENCAHLLSSQP